MKKLTTEEEILIVKSIRKFIANGSSRAVFHHPFDEKLAVKIAIGSGGLAQTQREIEVNTEIPEVTNTIHAYGKYIIVCDLIVKKLDQKVDHAIYNYFNASSVKQFRNKELEIVKNIVRELARVNGESGDNHQIGITVDGKIVSYDYGYTSKIYCDQVDCWNGSVYKNFPKMALEKLKG
jgi:hypothetical protein